MKTYLKTLGRMFSKHVTRFISIIFIVLLAVGFSSGVGSATDKIDHSLDEYYRSANISDFIIKDTSGEGFSDDDIQELTELLTIVPEDDCEEAIVPTIATGMSVDVNLEINGQTSLTRLYFLDNFPQFTINVPDILEQSQDSAEHPAYAQQANNTIWGVPVGTEITLDFIDILDQLSIQDSGEGLSDQIKALLSLVVGDVNITVTGRLQSPLLIAVDGEPSYVNGEDIELPETGSGLGELTTVDNVLYLSSDIIPSILKTYGLGRGDIYVAVGDRDIFGAYSGGYESYVDEMAQKIEQWSVTRLEEDAGEGDTSGGDAENPGENVGTSGGDGISVLSESQPSDPEEPSDSAEPTVQIITLYDNFSLYSLYSYSQKVEALGWVLVVAFLFVTALVVYSNISRLVEEERGQIACMRTLGYSSFKIIFKYALFAAIAAGIGGFGAYFVGEGLSQLIYYVFNYSYVMPAMSLYFSVTFFVIVFAIIAATIMFATIFSGIRMTSEMPASLLRPKPPKAGKKVIFERFPKFWNILPFKYKSTVRNVLRYKSRFLMTVVAVAISMALVMAGLALLDLCLFGSLSSPSIIAISVIIVVFAGLLTATVIYTLTNINISERNRELATLMVLGYQDGEVSGYIYREIYIDTLIGIMFGYPLAAVLIAVVFNMIGLGTLGGVSWFMWLIAPAVVALFTWVVTLLLRRKIVRVDMNESLKAIE